MLHVLIPSISPFIIFLLGLFFVEKPKISLVDIYNIYGIGIIFYFTLNFLTDIANSLIIVSLFVIASFIKIMKKRPKFYFKIELKSVITISIFLIFTLHLMLYIPVKDWDASFIWYYAAKVMHYDGYLLDWVDGARYSIAAGYPKLIPLFSASFSTVTGVWNELLPGSALFIFLIHTMIGFLAILSKLRIPLIFVILVFFSLGRFTWNFYMDGYVALYAGISIFYLSTFLTQQRKGFLLASLISLAIVINIKNEGLLLTLSAMIIMIIFFKNIEIFMKQNLRKIFLYPLLFLPFILWNFWLWKVGWDRGGFSDSNYFNLVIERLDNELFLVVSEMIFVKHNFYYLIFLFVLFSILIIIQRKNKIRFDKQTIPILLMISIYMIGLILVYLGSTYGGGNYSGLKLHLDQSLKRVLLSVMIMGYVLIFILVSRIKINYLSSIS